MLLGVEVEPAFKVVAVEPGVAGVTGPEPALVGVPEPEAVNGLVWGLIEPV